MSVAILNTCPRIAILCPATLPQDVTPWGSVAAWYRSSTGIRAGRGSSVRLGAASTVVCRARAGLKPNSPPVSGRCSSCSTKRVFNPAVAAGGREPPARLKETQDDYDDLLQYPAT